jgi:hypothetical protein
VPSFRFGLSLDKDIYRSCIVHSNSAWNQKSSKITPVLEQITLSMDALHISIGGHGPVSQTI